MPAPTNLNSSLEAKQGDHSFSKGGSGVIRRIQSSASFLSLSKYNVVVQLLDDSQTIAQIFKKHTPGQTVLDYICDQLAITEKEYFGLRYSASDKHRYWLETDKTLSKEFHNENLALCFRFRFYPDDVSCLTNRITKYQLFVQLQRDLLHGRLQCSQQIAVQLAALVIQALLGDYDSSLHPEGYVSGYKLVLRQSDRMEEQIAELHKTYVSKTPDEACDEFLHIALQLDTYGFDPYTVKASKGDHDVVIGCTPKFVLIFVANQMVHKLPWQYVKEVNYGGKHIDLTLTDPFFDDESLWNHVEVLNNIQGPATIKESLMVDKNKKSIRLNCPKGTFAKHLWKHIISQKVFYNEASPTIVKVRRYGFPLGSRVFRCPTSRTMQEMKVHQPAFDSSGDEACLRNTLPRQKPRERGQVNSMLLLDTSGEQVSPNISVIVEDEMNNATCPPMENGTSEAAEQAAVVSATLDEAKKPNSTSTPTKKPESCANSIASKVAMQQNQRASNGVSFNSSQNGVQPFKSWTSKVASLLLTLILLSVLLTAFAIALFDVPNSATDSLPFLNHVRRDYYLPLKDNVLRRIR